MRAEHATYMGRKASLEGVIAEHGYSTESVRRLFQSGGLQGGLAPAGVLADFLEVEDRYEHVVEDFLRDELDLPGRYADPWRLVEARYGDAALAPA